MYSPKHRLRTDSGSSVATLLQPSNRAPRTLSGTLRVSSWILHVSLIAVHLLLIGIWAAGLENRVTVSLENQKFASFLITTATTTFGTIYSALLVFVTQSLSTRHNLRIDQLLTATHDNVAAWSGLGAAVTHLWRQRAVQSRASPLGVFSIALYLGGCLGLHISTSSWLSLVTSSTTSPHVAGTFGLPVYDGFSEFSYGYPIASNGSIDSDAVSDVIDCSSGAFQSLQSVLYGARTSLGLQQGTLYDVPKVSTTGNVTVDATGFNVSCAYVPDVSEINLNQDQWFASNYKFGVASMQPGVIAQLDTTSNNSVFFASSMPILDSSSSTGSLVSVNPPMNSTGVSTLQIFRCSLSPGRQTAVMDALSQQILSIGPDFTKSTSAWTPFVEQPFGEKPVVNAVIDTWGNWYDFMQITKFPLDASLGDSSRMATVGDVYLIHALNLPALNHDNTLNVTLHSVENALSQLVAAMFWTMGHIPPPQDGAEFSYTQSGPNGTEPFPLSQAPKCPVLLEGSANMTETIPIERLELNIIAISSGLVISLLLLALALPTLVYLSRGLRGVRDHPIDGTGILHSIWLYRNHPELETLLDQVDEPTEVNLRAAGMIRTRLVGSGSRPRKVVVTDQDSLEDFEMRDI